MSSKTTDQNKTTAQLRRQAYQPIPTTIPSPTLQATTTTTTIEDQSASMVVDGGMLPTTYSSQHLVTSSDSDSVESGERSSTTMVEPGGDGSRSHLAGVRRIGTSQWFTVTVLCFVNLINYMDRFTIAGVLTDIQDDFGIGDDNGGLLQTAFVLSYMFCAPVFGYLGDRYSRRYIMAIGVLLWSTTTLLGSFMNSFGWFITFRALVGIGEASYSTIAPTIISDLFVHDMRSKMLALFYFAIPVGSGLGYIVGSETAQFANNWRWALRVTPFLGITAVLLIMLIKDPERGESEGSHSLEATTYSEDIKDLLKNRSFMLSTAGFTCVAFVAGALAWWGPKFMFLGLRMHPGNENMQLNDVSYKFGIAAMVAGLIGVPLGSFVATRLRPNHANCDPYICAAGLMISSPMVYLGLVLAQTSATFCYIFVFLAQVSLNLCWSIVADILLYVVVPTRRSTAEAFQILISHALGDAGSPYLVGVLSEAIKKQLRYTSHKVTDFVASNGLESLSLTLGDAINSTTTKAAVSAASLRTHISPDEDTNLVKFEALQYALFSTCFVEVLGGIFFLITAAFIIKDKQKAAEETHGAHHAVHNRPAVDIDEIS